MRVVATSIALALSCAGCLPVDDQFTCSSNDQCVRDGEQGVCASTSFCAFADAACPISGRRYGAHAGDLSETCVVTGALYWVSPSGDDANPGTEQLPFRTIAHGVSVLAPRDAVLVRPGEYDESVTVFPAGLSWDEPVTLAAWPRRGATLRSPSADLRALEVGDPARFVVVEGLVVDGSTSTLEPIKTYQDHVRIRDTEVFGSPRAAIALSGPPGEAGYCELIDLDLHDNGTTLAEDPEGSPAGGIVASTGHNLIEGCHVHDNIGVGICLYTQDGNTDENVIRDNVVSGGVRADASGLLLTTGAGILAYNNVIREVSGPGIRVDYGAVDTRVLHNTVFAAAQGALGVLESATGTIARNNVFFGPGTSEGVVVDTGVSTVLSNNVTVDPLFIDASGGDFHVAPNSPAVDQGVTEPDVPYDIDGVARPQGAAYDVGAFER